jgi:KEOPS complex subunit Pcc1
MSSSRVNYKAEITVRSEKSSLLFKVLQPEIENQPDRSEVKVYLDEGVLTVVIHSRDVPSLRAALNTWMRLIKISVEIVSEVLK